MPNQQIDTHIPIVLTIAGSDSGGGAGIQADIKAISATGSYACSVITAITSQNTLGVSAIHSIPVQHIESQLDAVFSDLNIAAVKVGMLSDKRIISMVANKLRQYSPEHVVLDPVMIATSGDRLLQTEAISALKSELFPLATIITPNLPESSTLTGCEIPANSREIQPIINELRQLPCQTTLLKGGHFFHESESIDWLIQQDTVCEFSASRVNTVNTHGTGCTLSSAIASYLAQKHSLPQAVHLAKNYLTQAISHADCLTVGQGHGPVHHFYATQLRPFGHSKNSNKDDKLTRCNPTV